MMNRFLRMPVAALVVVMGAVLVASAAHAGNDPSDELDRQEMNEHLGQAMTCAQQGNFSCTQRELAAATRLANGNADRQAINRTAQAVEDARLRQMFDQAKGKYAAQQAAVEERAEESEQEIRASNRAAAAESARIDAMQRADQEHVRREEARSRMLIAEQNRRNTQELADISRRVNQETIAAIAETNRRIAEQASEKNRAARAAESRSTPVAAKSSPAAGAVVARAETDMRSGEGVTTSARLGNSSRRPTSAGQAGDPSNVGRADLAQISQAQAPGVTSDHAQRAQARVDSLAKNSAQEPSKRAHEVELGPIKPEMLAICRQGKSKGWACWGALDNQIIFDEPTVESALARQHCAGGTWAAGGPTIDGVKWEAYRCNKSLGYGDDDVAKRHFMTVARRSYQCPKNMPGDGRCEILYGQR
jgi:hypothetical protein